LWSKRFRLYCFRYVTVTLLTTDWSIFGLQYHI